MHKYNLQVPRGELDLPPQDHSFVKDYPYDYFWQKGYVVIDLPDVDCERIIHDVDAMISSGDYLAQNTGFQYSDSPRIFEAWKKSQAVLDLARHPKILSTLEFLYERKPIPFQTINFKIGSNQPLHSDVIHFTSEPPGWTVGVWVALEEMDGDNGTLKYVPKSHKFPYMSLQDLGLDKVDPELPKEEREKQMIERYRVYEDFVRDLTDGLQKEIFLAKPGQALLWGANLLHGGMEIVDKSRTRWSQANHYFFEGCEHYYCPFFSNRSRGEYAEKDLSQKDILNHVI